MHSVPAGQLAGPSAPAASGPHRAGPALAPGDAGAYRASGYLLVKDLFSPAEVEGMRREALGIFRGERGQVEGILPLTGRETEREVLARYNAIHFPHKLSPPVLALMRHPPLVEVLTQLIGPNVKSMQSMLFIKAPGKPGQSWHQDEYYIPTRDRSLTGAWIALDDAVVENGCLWVIPGSHRDGVIRRRVEYTGGEYADVDTCDLSPWKERDAVPVEVPAGGAVFFNGHLLHSSLRNRSTDGFRRALVFHYMSAESMLPWDNDGRFPHTEDMRDVVLVAGQDPHEHKGVAEVTRPFLRGDVLKHKASPELL